MKATGVDDILKTGSPRVGTNITVKAESVESGPGSVPPSVALIVICKVHNN